MNDTDYLILNCSASTTNMLINNAMLDLSMKHFKEQSEIMKSILDELKTLNERLKDGNKLYH
jgi:hypothetical protein